jgi:hypothetical protein
MVTGYWVGALVGDGLGSSSVGSGAGLGPGVGFGLVGVPPPVVDTQTPLKHSELVEQWQCLVQDPPSSTWVLAEGV